MTATKRIKPMHHECYERSGIFKTGICIFCGDPHNDDKPKGGHKDGPFCEKRRQMRIDDLRSAGIRATR